MQYVELLRHFYSILGRTGSQAATPGSQSEEKAKKILKRLNEIHEQLDTIKKNLGVNENMFVGEKSVDAISINAQAKCVEDIQRLRAQAIEVWRRHCAKHSGYPR